MPIDDAMVKRALCAARRAYPSKGLNLAQPEEIARTEAIGYLNSSLIIYSGDGAKWLPASVSVDVVPPGPLDALFRREAVTIGATAHEVMVAFRGTLPPDFLDFGASGTDWLNDARIEMTAVQGRPYRIHKGFYYAMLAMWPRVKAEIDKMVASHPGLPVVFTGHSKGGAMAQIAAMLFNRGPQRVQVNVCTFAAARAGDAAFVAAFDAAVDDARRYEYGADVVPHLPPQTGGVAGLLGMSLPEINFLGAYQSAGAIYYLPSLPALAGHPGLVQAPAAGAQPITNAATATAQSTAAIQGNMLHPSFTMNLREVWVGQNHSIEPLSGYDRWCFR